MTAFSKLVLFGSSYSPLMLIWALLLFNEHRIVSTSLCFLAAGSLIFMVGVFLWMKRKSPTRFEVTAVESKDGEAMSYIVTYLLPFLGTPQKSAVELGAMFAVLGIIAVLYLNSTMIYTNPVFNLLGYHLFAVDTRGGKKVMVVTKRDHIDSGRIRVHMAGNFTGLESSENERTRTPADS